MIKLIASDMDGTLLNEKMEVSSRNIQAIKDAEKNGIEFLIATGRGLSEAKPFLKNHVHPGFITLNGAEVFDTKGDLISSNPISREAQKQVIEIFNKYNVYFEVITDKGIFSNDREARVTNLANLLMKLNPGTSFKQALKDTQERVKMMPMNFVDNYDHILDNDSYQIMKLIGFNEHQHKVLAPLKKEITKKIKDVVPTSSSPNNVEVNSIHAQKGIALLQYAENKNILPEEIMAIGDNLNDYSMIRDAGVGVAMANAIPAIKEIAQIETESNINDGVAKIIEKTIAENQNQG
ncbi:HAD family phosphatase [Companilactobacillus zhachilii]|jgi:HAD-superfamily hydrolase, subfamily IIB|uniref:HAD family phosphatase n=1 Tax=Companilactobacillus zhachilii TaxID=2304606 RepID=A0A386PPW1_9LACO|nr:Cof-type HAD-IIB family hydrolase [Companilactobacillus zhachilii]AYE37754.1 HAD family phosphatase [Companilactobacillus zhachilii]MBL3532057.1 HAD family phosphatase [Companilactobacillus zhachilii]